MFKYLLSVLRIEMFKDLNLIVSVHITKCVSLQAADCVRGLLKINATERLGSGSHGAQVIMETAFFSSIDFEKLLLRALPPPFLPEVVNEHDTKSVYCTVLYH